MKIEDIPIESIRVLLSRAREKEGWEQLKASMADPQIGLRVPVGVRALAKPAGRLRYELLYGEGRLAAAKDLGWKTIPAVVKRVEDREVAGQFLAENMIRRAISWSEKGRMIRDELATGATLAEVARLLHITPHLAAKYHRVISKVSQDVEDEALALPINDAEALATVPAVGQRLVIALASETGERVRDVAKAAKRAVADGAGWTKAGLVTAISHARDSKKKLEGRLKVLRLHHALGPANVRALLANDAFRAAAKKAGLNLTKLEKVTE